MSKKERQAYKRGITDALLTITLLAIGISTFVYAMMQ